MVIDFNAATERLRKVVNRTPLSFESKPFQEIQGNVYLKREDLQVVRSYKLRGAYNMMSSLPRCNCRRGLFVPVQVIMPRVLLISCKKTECKRSCVHAHHHT